MNIERGAAASSSEDAANGSDRQREFLALLGPCLAPLNRFAMAMCRENSGSDCEAAKDLVSETVLRAFESFDRVRERQAFQSYLFTIAVRLNRLERKRRSRWTSLASEHFEIAS